MFFARKRGTNPGAQGLSLQNVSPSYEVDPNPGCRLNDFFLPLVQGFLFGIEVQSNRFDYFALVEVRGGVACCLICSNTASALAFSLNSST